MKTESRIRNKIFVVFPFLKGTQLSFHSEGSGSVNWIKFGNRLRGRDSVFMFHVRLLFIWPRIFLLIQTK